MANFLAILDRDSSRRRRVAELARDRIAPVEGLSVDGCELGELSLLWAANPRAPISTSVTPTGIGVVWGDAIPGPGPERLDGAGLFEQWSLCADARPPAFDGFHAALRYDIEGTLVVGADLLGYFPVCYAYRQGVLLVGSSAELFRLHPLFPARLDREGLVGLLLAHAPMGGRALLQGVRRLAPGFVLRLPDRDSEPEESFQYCVPVVSQRASGSFEEHVERLHQVLGAAVARHAPPGIAVGMLLSGGRDSRLLAGYLHRRGDSLPALTLGLPTDNETIRAGAVASALRMPHHRWELRSEDFALWGTRQARWEHLSAGFSTIHTWGAIAPMRELPSRTAMGYQFELLQNELLPNAFDLAMAHQRYRGIPIGTLRRLLRRDVFGSLADELFDQMRVEFEAWPIADERGWRFLLAHERRVHAGGVPWRLSFGSWPVLPILDRELLATLVELPPSSLEGRRAQHELLRTRFSNLARLPLDQNALDTTPLLPTPAQRLHHSVRQGAEWLGYRLPALRLPRPALERRYYYRVYDLDGPGWLGVRATAEPYRERLGELFDLEALGDLVPGPGRPMGLAHIIRDAFVPKMLIGLMLWHGRET